MYEVGELLTWLLDSGLITVDQVRVWEAKAYLYVNNHGAKNFVQHNALRELVRWYQERR